MVAIPIELFLGFIGSSIALAIFGFLRTPQVPAMVTFGGMFILAISVITTGIIIGYDITEITSTQEINTNSTVFSYNVMSGVTNFTLRFDSVASFAFTEYASTSASALIGDTIQCISYELIRVGNAIPNSNVQFGIFSGTENFVQFYGNVSASSISTSEFAYYTVCVPEGQEHIVSDGERIGIKYKYGNSTNFLRAREDSANPFDGTISVRSSMVTTTWAQSSTRDVNARFWDYEITFNDIIMQETSPNIFPFTDFAKVLFALLAVILMLCGGLMLARN